MNRDVRLHDELFCVELKWWSGIADIMTLTVLYLVQHLQYLSNNNRYTHVTASQVYQQPPPPTLPLAVKPSTS